MSQLNKSNLLQADYLIDLSINNLEQVEAAFMLQEKLIPEYQDSLSDLVEAFADDKSLQDRVEKFLNIFFLLMQRASSILDPKLVIEQFQIAEQAFNDLNAVLDDSQCSDDLKELIEDYGLTIENRLRAVLNEQDFINKHLADCIKNSLQVDKKASTLKLVFQDLPGPLIGMNDLLNYQLKQIIEINKMLYSAIEEQMEANKLKKLIIPSQNISDELIDDFYELLAEDKQDLSLMQEKDFINPDDEELIQDIALEVASNLIYRIYWEDKFKVEVE